MTRRRWIADEWSESAAVLRDAQANHLSRVLRAKVGQQFDIVAGGAVRRGVIDEIGERHVRFALGEDVESAAALRLTVGLGIIRFEHMEWAIEKLTELGVARIVPLRSERTEKHLAQAAEKRVERWRKIALESAQQARRDEVPEISAPTSLPNFAAAEPNNLRLLFSEREQARSLYHSLIANCKADAGRTIVAAVGPEGGWSDRDLAVFSKHEWEAVSLSRRILRAETAAIAVASFVNLWMQS